MTVIKIRRATEKDASAIAKVHVNSWQSIYRGSLPDAVLDSLSIEQRTKEWHERLDAGIDVWVAEVNHQIVGFASMCPSRDEDADPIKVVEISAIYLLPEFWRKGIGIKLCEPIFHAAAKNGFKEITLWVLESNTRAIKFYESIGFIGTEQVSNHHMGCDNLRVIRYKKNID